jgi:hypothetical protein
MFERVKDTMQEMEPDTPPSMRFNRIVTVGTVFVLETRDPNSDQGGPSDKPRHQYLMAGGQLWYRRLPPEAIGDAWADTGEPAWELREIPASGLVRTYAEEAPASTVVSLRRLRTFTAGDDAVSYKVRGRYVGADNVEDVNVLAGPVTDSCWTVPLPPCPDCGGNVVWAEAGLVPGARECLRCGSLFSVTTST